MLKIEKLLIAVGIISMILSFTGCGLKTEAELLNGGKGTGLTPGSNTGSSSPIWSKFDGADMQVWNDEATKKPTALLEEKSDCLAITIKAFGWWGMCFCNNASTGPGAGCTTFDMSNVKKITFEAKASENASMWVSQSNSAAQPTNQKKIELSTSYEEKTYVLNNPGKTDYGVLDLGGGDLNTTTKSDVVISIKNIKFFDANDVETIPARNE